MAGCATATLWDRTKPSAFPGILHVGIPAADEQSVVVGFGRRGGSDEQWFLFRPGSPGPESFWIVPGDLATDSDRGIRFPEALEHQFRQSNVDRLDGPPPETKWLRVRPFAVSIARAKREAGTYGYRETLYAFDVESLGPFKTAIASPAHAPATRPTQTVLVLPRAPKGAQTGDVILAVVLTPPAFALDVLTFPISVPLAAWRPAMGP